MNNFIPRSADTIKVARKHALVAVVVAGCNRPPADCKVVVVAAVVAGAQPSVVDTHMGVFE